MDESLADHLAHRLKRLRLSRHLTQEQIAEDACISYKYYQAIEAGRKRNLRLTTIERLAGAHGLTVSQLLDQDEKRFAARVARLSEESARYRMTIRPLKRENL